MADEVPICEVLCEATEYLSRLGTNLRTRSENLKEKKISKEKLKNVHAVQKAAQKVLLICELSKKSLENVETGVKKILSAVDASQSNTNDGAKTSASSKSKERKPEYHYFVHGSRKLKIKRKIPLKHYLSVKVMTRDMPLSMQDKYPVYFNCKLYRSRKRKERASQERLQKAKEKIVCGSPHRESSSERKSFMDCTNDTDNAKKKEQDYNNSRLPEHSSKNHKEIEEDNKFKPRENEKDFRENVDLEREPQTLYSDSQDTDKNMGKEKKKFDSHTESLKSQDEDSDKTLICKSKDKSSGSIDIKEGISSKVQILDSKSNDTNLVSEGPEKEKNNVYDKTDESSRDKSSNLDDSEGDENTKNNACEDKSKDNGSESCNPKQNKDVSSKKSKDRSLDSTNIKEDNNKGAHTSHKCVKNKLSKYKRLLLEDSDSNNEDENTKNNKDNEMDSLKTNNEVNLNKSEEEHQNDEVKLIESDTKKIHKDNLSESHENKIDEVSLIEFDDNEKVKEKEENMNSNDGYNQNAENLEVKRPLIKCVNINKLLKSDITVNEKDKSLVKPTKTECKSKSKVKPLQDLIKTSTDKPNISGETESKNISERLSEKEKKENEYWKQKRKEVDAFKPKLFVINITRLPKFSKKFLHEHTLKKITCDGSIVFQLISETNNDFKDKTSDTLDDDVVKKGSNKHYSENKNIESSVNQVKSYLLNDSDSDKSVDRDLVEVSEKVKDSILNMSDCDKNDYGKTANSKDKNNYSICDSNKDKELESSPETVANNENNKSINNAGENCEETDLSGQNTNKTKMQSDSKEKEISNKEMTPPNTDNDKMKSSLLNDDSSDDNLKTPNNKQKRKKSSTPQSKRKHIMEIMHAKKMLLTYSSSSDTDDEQLRNALKEIKKSLLKGISSSDEENGEKEQEKGRKKLFISSDSDEDILKRFKKRKLSKNEETKDNLDENKSVKDTSNTDELARDMDERSNSSCSKMGRSRTKPGGSSSQNSDNQEANDKDIDGLTNLKSLHKTHRSNSSSSVEQPEDSKSSKKEKKIPKVEPIIEPEMLKEEETSSEAASLAGSDVEELPRIGLNGDGVGHLAKDDLLEDSVSSSTQNDNDKNSEEDKKDDDTDEEHNVKSKRRKALAISSDSEAGSSRKKHQEPKSSDFEDSGEESSSSVKRKKRKKGSDSDASSNSSNDGNKKKRRRIKQLKDSDASGSDSENEGKNKHGRKNIRKVMGKDQLEEATKKAARQEKERIARIAERQKLYNNLEFDESGKPDEVVLEKVVLDFDPETKEPLIEVDRGLVKKLKPHQANGIKFMWNACFESVKRIKKDKGSGCILAHCMGLGKTLQVVSLTHTLLIHSSLTKVNRVLVVCPLSTVLNWVNEFRMWLKHAETEYEVDVYELSRYKQNSERAFQLQQWFDGGGVCVLGYEMFRNLSADNPKKFRKKMLRSFQESLVDPGPDLVVCDEGHLLKNEKTSLSQSMNRVKTQRRIVLTGTPLQNNLKEYYCMVQFVKPNLLGKYNEYLNRFVNPITNGQYTDSTEYDIKVMKRRSHVLHKMLDGAVQRRDYGVLAPFLPPKHEFVLFITLTEVQIKLYQYYLDNYSRRPLAGKSSGFLFPDFQSLQRIWTHPLVLKYNSERYEIMQQKKREREEEDSEGSLADFIDDDSTPEESTTEESSDDSSDLSDDSIKKSKKKKSSKKNKGKESKVTTRRGTRANPIEIEDEEKPNSDVEEVKNENPTEWWIKLVTDDELEDMRNSHKLVLLFDILRQCEAIGDKLLVFSQSLYSLDLIEHFLGKVDEATQEGRIDEKLGGHVGSWSPGIDYFRLDGSTSCENRSIWCKNFNREDNPRARLFLISTRAGGLGINLVAANRVVIFDVSWNPSHDVQSIFRVYRFGQKKPCYIYRFLAMGTMEEKIYERQVTKQAISKRVIDEQQIDRHYAENDLAELYKFEATPPTPRPLPPLPKDRLFAEMLKEHEAQIYKYHEHDSLLENKEEETLSEEERKAAWEDFENEKNKPPPAPFPSPWPMQLNGMAPGLLAQQQQQLAYAALAAMLRKDMPNINENQLRDMLPLIYNSNPALMQKMSEIYKYAQPGMMNPGMMNPVMNPAGGGMGAMGGVGGTSGLQYEPPWQRQHQHQQQMRLQQMIQQQQNQMGAKYYAGGLGSRDPVAMALQQQRAREIMLGERGRPRGRPPLQPRPPSATAAPADVVNLDSD